MAGDRALHALCEWLLAGPQHAASGTIRLRVTDDGIATVAQPHIELTAVAVRVGGREVAICGTIAELAQACGLPLGRPDVTYRDPVPADPDTGLRWDSAGFREAMAWYRPGRDALLRLRPDETPTLWPEHMDLAIRSDDVNYGVAPADGHSPVPYAYIGPDLTGSADDPFWNAPFGASVPIGALVGADAEATSRAIEGFFREGAHRLAG
jgi:hypothetical protein